MKRYEYMTTEEVMKAFNTPYELPDNSCLGCVVWGWDYKHGVESRCSRDCKNQSCVNIVRNFLNEEVGMKSRWQTVKSDEDMVELMNQWYNNDANRKYSMADWMCQKVEN